MENYCYYCMDELSGNGPCGCDRSRKGEPPIPGATPPGTILNGRYLIGYPLGAGGFGMTYIGRDLNLDMKVAVKEYTEGAAGGKERFLREARAMARFAGQSGIVNVRDFFEANGTAFIVMEYLEGMTLKEYITRFGPISWDQALTFMLPVLEVLGKIHKAGYVHRDVSPDNIMMLKDGSIKLLDFGAAADVSGELLKTMTVMLKPGYAPPEQYQGKGGIGPWTDVYAACATFYKCITGETPQDSLSRMFEDQLPPPSHFGADVPEYAQQVLFHGLAVHKEARIRSMEELIQGLTGPAGACAGAAAGSQSAGGGRGAAMSGMQHIGGGQGAATPGAQPEKGGRTVTMAGAQHTGDGRGAAMPGAQPEKDGRTVTMAGAQPAAGEQRAATSGTQPAAGGKSRGKASGGKKNKKVLWLSLAGAGVIIVALCLVLLLSGGVGSNPYREADSSNSYLKELTVTDKMIDTINHDEYTEIVSFSDCVITDELLAELAKNTNVYKISLDNCSGFTSLNALASMPALEALSVYVESGGTMDGAALFSVPFPTVTNLSLGDQVTFSTGTDFLANFPSLTTLYIPGSKGVENLNFLAAMPGLNRLFIYDIPLGDKDYSALAGCTALEELSAANTGISNLTVLAANVNMSSLDLNGCGITDLTPLAGMTGLRTLYLKDNAISDLTPLAGMTQMTNLYLSGNQITDLSPLAGMMEMFDLYVDNNQITDLTPLTAMIKLANLNIRNNQIQNLDACKGMINLVGFWGANNALTDVSSLISATSLLTLDLQNNQISDVSMFSNGFPELRYVNLSDNQIADISGLAQSSKLRAVLVANNQLTSLDGLENKPELKGIMANNNQISDISALSTSMAELQYIDLGNNQISDISVLSGLAGEKSGLYAQTALLLENNQITSLSSLPSTLNYKLAIYGNPISDYSPISTWSEINYYWDMIYISYNAQADVTPLLEAGFGSNFYIVDTPVEEQAAIQRQAKELRGTVSSGPEFVTREMADATMDSLRDEIRASLGGEPDDGNEQSSVQ